eukprot:Nitzschia sp. Nitz4//scaffold154_size52827//22184//25178//NITZ4_006776-RA/size52827-snap-gene-0.3-mRNA-1//1//CDS//3329537308//8756//frame0
MGCGASKEAPVATSAPPRSVPEAAAAKPPAPKPAKATPSRDEGQVQTVTLNDMSGVKKQPLTKRNNNKFSGYASGASSPNTSEGNLSWDARSDANSDQGSIQESRTPKRNNPKKLKSQGSAIGLDDLHNSERAGLHSKVVHIEVPFGKPIEEVYDGVHNGPVLGSGVSGLVRQVKHKATGVEYAVKCLDLGLVGTSEGLAQLREEIFIMCQLDHPNIVRLEEVYESHSEIYLVQELCTGGELFDRLDEQPDYHYTEAECARLVKQMLSAVRYLHSKGIIHRDLKLENFLFSSKAKDSELRMIDFGLSKHFQFGEVHHEAVGTPYTVAPEVIKGSYDERCDIWAIGVITYLLLSGDPPFGGCGGPEPLLTVRANILHCKYEFEPEDVWGLVSETGKNFIRDMLVLDPKHRPTAREAQKHAWLKEWANRHNPPAARILNPNVVKALVNFKEFSHVRKLLSEVLSFTLLPDQIKDLRKEFEKMDTDGSGEISLAGLKQVLVTNAGAGSLGALTEEEVEGIFNAMRVNKTETTIHWHEFIAAGLSQCQVDDRNLRLAFDRLDSNHKGFITLDDIMHLVGNDGFSSEEHLRHMWTESMRSVNCTTSHIDFDSFRMLMKGQTKELEQRSSHRPPSGSLGAVPENESEVSLTKLEEDKKHEEELSHMNSGPGQLMNFASVPNLGVDHGTGSTRSSISDTPPIPEGQAPEFSTMPKAPLQRKRSKSAESEKEAFDASDSYRGNARIAVALEDPKTKQLISQNASALSVNRQLYRAHRQMRLSVLEASKLFEQEQARRARDALMAQKAKEAGLMGLGQAGLVMRHGTKLHVTTENIRQYLEDYRKEQQQLVEKANRRGGRGRGNRKKTISDMSAMLNPSMGQEELGDIASKAAARTPEGTKQILNSSIGDLNVPELQMPGPEEVAESEMPTLKAVKNDMRTATVPGEFRVTKDPFGADGMYGGARIEQVDVREIATSPAERRSRA